jgi:tetratricopeptide repeat protein 21B
MYYTVGHVQYIQDAMREFEGTVEEVRVVVADSQLAIARGDVDAALSKVSRRGVCAV